MMDETMQPPKQHFLPEINAGVQMGTYLNYWLRLEQFSTMPALTRDIREDISQLPKAVCEYTLTSPKLSKCNACL
jgi:hypothetical protein